MWNKDYLLVFKIEEIGGEVTSSIVMDRRMQNGIRFGTIVIDAFTAPPSSIGEEQGSDEITGLTHQDLAESVGTYRETATQVLNDLKAGGYIEIGRKRIKLLNREGLEMVAES